MSNNNQGECAISKTNDELIQSVLDKMKTGASLKEAAIAFSKEVVESNENHKRFSLVYPMTFEKLISHKYYRIAIASPIPIADSVKKQQRFEELQKEYEEQGCVLRKIERKMAIMYEDAIIWKKGSEIRMAAIELFVDEYFKCVRLEIQTFTNLEEFLIIKIAIYLIMGGRLEDIKLCRMSGYSSD
jgi:hypothetical protein